MRFHCMLSSSKVNTPSRHKYNMIVAATKDWYIGNDNRLLVSLGPDMRFFKAVTMNKVVVMGRKTQESLANHKYLENRVNIVLSNSIDQLGVEHHGDKTVLTYKNSIDDIPHFIKFFNEIYLNDPSICKYDYMTDGDVFIIGGGSIYSQFLQKDMIDTIYLTTIHESYEGDTKIPNLYNLGFNVIDTITPKSISKNGIKYSINILKK